MMQVGRSSIEIKSEPEVMRELTVAFNWFGLAFFVFVLLMLLLGLTE